MASAYDNWLEGDCGVNDAAEAHGEAVEAKIDELRADPEAMAKAYAKLSGDLPEVAYAGLEGWLADIGDMLPPSGRVYADDLGKLPQHVVARLAEAARIASAARMTVLRDMAESQIKREEEQQDWLRDGTTVYALNLEGSNRFSVRVEGGWTTQGRTRTQGDELVANARLIAAAPELLEALWLAMEWNWLDDDARPSRVAEICDAAIAKATGESA